MVMDSGSLLSAVVFGPQSKEPKPEYLVRIRESLCQNKDLAPFVAAITELPKIWTTFQTHNPDIVTLAHGPQGLQALADWISNGASAWICKATYGIVALPVLAIIQITQYFEFLRGYHVKHRDVIRMAKRGAGIQGYCSGFFMAAAVATSENEKDLVQKACNALRLSVIVGLYSDLSATMEQSGQGTMVMYLKSAGQLDEILSSFPKVHISAVTDPKTISVVGPEIDIASLRNLVSNQGLVTQRMHLSGKVHNPENTALAHHLKNVCTSQAEFQLPGAASLKASLRSNRTAQSLSQTSLTDEAIETVLASPCQWYDILIAMSKDLTKTTQTSHRIASFGLANCISVGVFEQAGLQIAKLDIFPAPRELPLPIVNAMPACPQLDPIAVVGMACRLPGANNVEELWDLLAAGKSMAEEVPKSRIDIHKIFRARQDAKWASRQRFYGNFISDVEAFDNAFFRTNPREAIMMDPQQRLLLETAYQAMESSGYFRNHRRKDGDNVGVFIGASFAEYLEHTCSHPPTGYTSTGTIRAFLCGKISYYFGWSGPSEIIDTACSSSLVAIHRACKAIQMGECHSAIAGGVNIMTTATNFMDLGKAGFLSPTGQCKPFDAAADGYCRSEGVGLIVLKHLSQAMADGDNILAVIPGIATNQGGLSSALTVPSSPSQITLYKTILNQARIDSAQVSYVEAHGTGTQAGDPLEVASIRQVFGGKTRQNELSIGSIKANLGHCETAAGVAGVIKAILMINKKHLPPLANFRQLNPKIPDLQPDRMSIATKLTSWESNFRAVCVNSYGAGGSNAAALLCQPPVNVPAAKDVKEEIPYPVMISASSKESFDLYIGTLGRYVSKLGTEFTTGNLALALDMRRRHHKYLWTSVLTNKADFRTLQQASQNLAELPQEIKNVVLSFSGQSRQTIGLDQQLYESCHLFRSHIDHCDDELTRLGNKSLIPAILKKDNISDIVTLQCGSFAVQYASAMSWIDSGLKVAAVIGHSFGELTAMAVSGILDLKSALSIVSARAKLMQTMWGSEPGSMLAVHEPLAAVRDIISSVPKGDIEIEIACYNSNSSHVLVGSSDAISRVEESLQANSRFSNVKFARLNVTHGFHSRFTERLLKPLEEVASSKVFHSAKIPLESCTFESLTEVSATRIAQHTREPVYFYQAVHRLEQRLGSCFFLEAGIESPIVPMIKRSAKNPERHTFLTLSSTLNQPFLSSLAKATATMLSEGISVSHWLFHTPQYNGLKHIWQFLSADFNFDIHIYRDCQRLYYTSVNKQILQSHICPSGQSLTSSEMSNPESNPSRASRFIEDIPDPLRPQATSDLLFSILLQMDEFEQKRKHRASHSSAESWGSSGAGQDHVSKINSGWLKSVKDMGIKDKLRGLVKTSGT